MQVVVIGQHEITSEFKEKFTSEHSFIFAEDHNITSDTLDKADVIFDFIVDENPEGFELYAQLDGVVVFCNTVKISLAELAYYNKEISCALFGFNGLPTMINREQLEVSIFDVSDQDKLAQICSALDTSYLVVDDRVGLVTPRVVCMIINEAFYTVQEGTAEMADIDLGMKLGTNYPFGPFEWCDKIGIKHVYEVLEAVYEDTKDERYKICSLLKKRYLRET
ncbi:3-hydroxyacyl-CoA dehydrogenase family protein [Fulvivirgaceae bacterium BMA10]|uniref:3-hydroxyacyl-CoA dehydrogenase family protein n=1 Tax=Splendidivirga corallicola TaxID=3051826 RepID=A0ABT8KTA5_9BACT|nr:3-hydroxyacyl-CoA dehydrogenase family protein [Fulvivirgaceae bacterium BMA10]